VRTRLGGALEQADGLDDRLADERTAAQATRSAAEDVDMAQAVSDFQMRQTSYDAALKTYSMVQRLSLFDYIR
jgi:flagellar hook-associated protein 3 FlgL